MRVAVLCPTRARRAGLLDTHASMLKTSADADMIACVDDDDAGTYEAMGLARLKFSHAPRTTVVGALNAAILAYPGYDAYGYIVDDARFTTPDWDKWFTSVLESTPSRIVLVSPHHSGGDWVNFPFVSKEWVKALGWFACPDTAHYCWDTVAEMLGDATAIRWATKEEFFIEHDMLPNPKAQEDFQPDSARFLWWCVGGRREAVRSLRRAMA